MEQVVGWPDWPTDELGPRSVTILRLAGGVPAVVAVDNTTLGPAIGGVRMRAEVTPAEVVRLARGMTLKSAAVGLPNGGAKSGIAAPPGLPADRREALIRSFATCIAGITDYLPGPDMGTDETAMAWVHDEIGRAVGRPAALGGIPLDVLGATGYGLAVCAEVLQEHGLLRLDGARIAIQGFGAVGRHAALRLHQRGARVIAVSDIDGAVANPDGLDIPKLTDFCQDHSPAEFPGGAAIDRDDLLGTACDVLIPAAQPDVLDRVTAGQVRARIVLEGANIPATGAAEQALRDRGVLIVPDIIANAGGVICAAAESRGLTATQAFTDIAERLRTATTEWLGRVTAGATPRQAALDMATARLTTAAGYRRSF
ncbi:Glu/Leu/Phe/Val family dehydrogenase [Kribbella solani]|uniref:Glutamate dehydrogenase n=1 Tax=Kribbella solani TaxID=236067 RepID=A0A841DH40_9ACTN|nr:Glu/Leu/Phe/Val dehydrogenase [Kribbella solani]MBB5978454.1 glutamate dehydrogenase/leucine dehydrogenase [Kribbella solani]